MESIDEFDVDISKLWKWKKQIEIKDGEEVILTAYLRIPGDADINRARVYALRESAILRKNLRNKDNPDRYAYLLPFDLITDNDLLEYTSNLLLRKQVTEISNSVDIPIPKRPDENASLEEHEKYQEEVDNWVFKRLEKITQITKEKQKEIMDYLSKLSKEEIYKIYEAESIDLYCENLLSNLFVEQCIYYGLFKDQNYKQRLFNNFEDFTNLPTNIKEQLKVEYNSLLLSSEELKK